jgi:hypothetical protein
MFAKTASGVLSFALFSSLAVGQSVSSASLSIGGGDVPATADASNSTVDILDSDLLDNDELELGLKGFISKDADGNWVTKDVNTKLFCDDGQVKGNNDGSGENPAEVFVRVTFRDAAGAVVKVVETTTKTVKCL